MTPFTKMKKFAQRAAGAGWNRHVNPWQRRKANKIIRRKLREEARDA